MPLFPYIRQYLIFAAPVRLLDGATYGEGQVEVLAGADTWGPICGNGWDKTDADIVCKQMGFVDGAAEGGL